MGRTLNFLVHPSSHPDFIEPFATYSEADTYAYEQSNDDSDEAWIVIEVKEGIGEVASIRYLGELFYPARLVPSA
jgi:hypothetical protein